MKALSTPAPTLSTEYYFFNLTPLCNKTRGLVWEGIIDFYGFYDALADTSVVQAIWLVLSVLIVAGNIGVIAWRLLSKKEQRNSIPSILVINLSVADFLFGAHFLIYVLMSDHFFCFAWVSPNYIPLMKSLCVTCQILENTCVLVSAMIGFTIAVYYATVFFGRFCCIRRLSRWCVTVFLCSGWLMAVAGATCDLVLTKGIWFGYVIETQEVKDSSRVTNQLIPDNSTFSIIYPQRCLPVLSFLQSKQYLNVVLLIVGCFILMTAGIYLTIARKLLSLSATNSSFTGLSTSLGGISLRLVSITIITVIGWGVAVALTVVEVENLEIMLPLAVVALSNPLTFTLTSQPFILTLKKVKQRLCFKIGRPIPIEDVANDSESLLPTRLLPSDTN